MYKPEKMAMSEIHEDQLNQLRNGNEVGFLVRLVETKGSAPRDSGAWMLVYADRIFGTIGGGRAEWIAITRAREMLTGREFVSREDITLGPAIDQCCGGTLVVKFEKLRKVTFDNLLNELTAQSHRSVYIFGAGHTGRALADALKPLPFKTHLNDTRSNIGNTPTPDDVVVSAIPEDQIRSADPDSFFVVATHDHSLDFLITAEALARGDAKYVGMIGSKTKRAAFASWLINNGYGGKLINHLNCPIGGNQVRDKRPTVIAAMTAAEIIQVNELS